MNFQGYVYGAESAWNPVASDGITIDRRFFKQRYGIDDARLPALAGKPGTGVSRVGLTNYFLRLSKRREVVKNK